MSVNKMDHAREQLREWIELAQPNERVASVSSLSEAVGKAIATADGRNEVENEDFLSTGPTVAVLNEAIDAGWLYSTRGPSGGYWRTDRQSYRTLDATLTDLEDKLRATLEAISATREAIAAS